MPPPLEDKDEVMEELMKELVFALFFHTNSDTLSSIADRPFSDDIDLTPQMVWDFGSLQHLLSMRVHKIRLLAPFLMMPESKQTYMSLVIGGDFLDRHLLGWCFGLCCGEEVIL